MLFAPNDLFLSLEREKGQWREYAGKRPGAGNPPMAGSGWTGAAEGSRQRIPAAFAGVLVFLRSWNFALQIKIKLFERLYRELFYFGLRF